MLIECCKSKMHKFLIIAGVSVGAEILRRRIYRNEAPEPEPKPEPEPECCRSKMYKFLVGAGVVVSVEILRRIFYRNEAPKPKPKPEPKPEPEPEYGNKSSAKTSPSSPKPPISSSQPSSSSPKPSTSSSNLSQSFSEPPSSSPSPSLSSTEALPSSSNLSQKLSPTPATSSSKPPQSSSDPISSSAKTSPSSSKPPISSSKQSSSSPEPATSLPSLSQSFSKPPSSSPSLSLSTTIAPPSSSNLSQNSSPTPATSSSKPPQSPSIPLSSSAQTSPSSFKTPTSSFKQSSSPATSLPNLSQSFSKPLSSSPSPSLSSTEAPPSSSNLSQKSSPTAATSSSKPPQSSSEPISSSAKTSPSSSKPPTSSSKQSLSSPKPATSLPNLSQSFSKPPSSSPSPSLSTTIAPPSSSNLSQNSSPTPLTSSSKPPQSPSKPLSSSAQTSPSSSKPPTSSFKQSSSSHKPATSPSNLSSEHPSSSSSPSPSSWPNPTTPSKPSPSSSGPNPLPSFKTTLSSAFSDSNDQKMIWLELGTSLTYKIPKDIEDLIKKDIVPRVLKMPLSPSTYKDYFAALLYAEDFYVDQKWSDFKLENVTLELQKGTIYKKSDKNTYINESGEEDDKMFVAFEIENVPEKRPFLLSRDFVLARPSRMNIEPFKGILNRVEKSTRVLVEFGKDFHSQHYLTRQYDVSFSFNRVCLKLSHEAIAAASDSIFRNFIFPYNLSRNNIPTFPHPLSYYHKCDQDQKSAVIRILSFQGPPPYLVQGPLCVSYSEGLSRTGLVVREAVLQIFRTSPKSRILICAPLNKTCDVLMKSLKQEIPESDMFRANAAFRELDKVPIDILPHCPYEGVCFVCPRLQELQKFRVVLSTFISSFRLHKEGIPAGHFTHIFLVDSSLATEPETMVVVANLADEKTSVVVTGAPRNYSGLVRSDFARENGLRKSYFERLRESNPYRSLETTFITDLDD